MYFHEEMWLEIMVQKLLIPKTGFQKFAHLILTAKQISFSNV